MAAEPTPAQNGFSAKCLLAATVAFFGAGVVAFTAGQLHGSLYAVSSTATTRPFTTARVPTRLGVQAPDADKIEVEKYFEDTSKDGGFDRWRRIYSDSEDVNAVQKDIREGHQITVDKVLWWFQSDPVPIAGKTVADLGCGTGLLAVPLAKQGAIVSASDISGPMAEATTARAEAAGIDMSKFTAYKSDLESVTGKYDTVTCIDVLIHYPEEKMQEMIRHLASISNERIIVSFAPKLWYYELLKKIGSYFPGPSKTTRAYLHDEDKVIAALQKYGFKPKRKDLTATSFYFSRVIEAVRE
eukprot:CAMPEP_0174284718 /NCGR_PEP_ID=MMETSP0809-20121228/6358_1 /TAXON_ID=73025 ORGANISM="Eutreptiella gymnastica-like, Strain CCMP1594" /NCGR_SAMPLE_ID=MMETSP0809 /ASSEMBLY_ACC=CAM_ASM_000658 /LENGTH=298 /DNA_ID=CAMNT_0015380323 /DNA_START=34 /DNA_END=930 /DNA_ORIENTATION=+